MERLIADFLVKSPFILSIIFVLAAIVVESIYPCEKDQPDRGKTLNLINSFFVSVSSYLAIVLSSVLAAHLHMGFIDLRFFPHQDVWSQLASLVLLVFLGDVLFYIYHRMEHTIPVLWDIHALHHSEQHFNATTYFRRHWLEEPLQKILISLPMLILFKLSPVELPLASACSYFIFFFTHMNIRLEFGKFSWLLTGPQLHRLHHSFLPQHQDSNYAQVFPIIDKIFGTYVAPAPHEFVSTGLASGERIDTLSDMLLWPFKKWTEKMNVILGKKS